MKDHEWLDGYLLAKKGAVKDYKAEWEWERFMVGGKMFAALCFPSAKYAAEYAQHPLVNLKCAPVDADLLKAAYPDILPGFYMDKQNWVSVRLDGNVPRELMEKLCDGSYALIFSKLTKKLQKEISDAR